MVPYLTVDDLLIVEDESIGHGWGHLQALQPEAHMALLKDLIAKCYLQRDN